MAEDYDILQEAGGIVGAIEVEDGVEAITALLAAHPNGQYLFMITDSNIEDATTIEVNTNCSSIDGLGICQTYQWVTMNGMWGVVDEEVEEE